MINKSFRFWLNTFLWLSILWMSCVVIYCNAVLSRSVGRGVQLLKISDLVEPMVRETFNVMNITKALHAVNVAFKGIDIKGTWLGLAPLTLTRDKTWLGLAPQVRLFTVDSRLRAKSTPKRVTTENCVLCLSLCPTSKRHPPGKFEFDLGTEIVRVMWEM